MMQAKARVGAELSAARGEINALKDKHGDAKPEEVRLVCFVHVCTIIPLCPPKIHIPCRCRLRR